MKKLIYILIIVAAWGLLTTALPVRATDHSGLSSNSIVSVKPISVGCNGYECVTQGLEYVKSQLVGLVPNREMGIVELTLAWINFALGFLTIIAIITIIYAGVLYISPVVEKKEKANKLILNTVIGILIIFLSYAIVNFIFSFFI